VFLLVAQLGMVLLLYISGIVTTWSAKDAFGIKKELKFLVIIIPVLFIPVAVNGIVPFLSPNFHHNYFLFLVFLLAFSFSVLHPIAASYYVEKNPSTRPQSEYSQEEKHALGKDLNKLFIYIMESPPMRRKFLDFCVQTWSVESFLFYQEATTFEQISDPNSLQEEATRISEIFIMINSPKELNIEHPDREQILEKIASRSVDQHLFQDVKSWSFLPHPSCFQSHLNDPLLEHVEKQLKEHTLILWRRTPEFKEAYEDSFLVEKHTNQNTSEAIPLEVKE